jgi:outer membrane protein assembly factor BamB
MTLCVRALGWLLPALLGNVLAQAEDWPEYRGKGRRGVWTETGVLDTFPASGLEIKWRVPIRPGYAGPAVAGGRVFVTDFERRRANQGTERIIAIDEETGKILWTHQWETNYTGIMDTTAHGPRSTPTVDGDLVYVLGTMGILQCLDARTGQVLWMKDFVKEYKTEIPTWGTIGAPLVEGGLLISLVGGAGNAKAVAFDKLTGKEVWRALPTTGEPGYGHPFLAEHGETRQVIIWHSGGVAALEPKTGKVHWEQEFREFQAQSFAGPALSRGLLFVSTFHAGSMMLELDAKKPTSKVLWKASKDATEVRQEALHAGFSPPVVDGEYIYGICAFGELRCLRARTGERIWENLQVTGGRNRWGSAFMVRHQDRYFINNDQGELIVARMSPKGYEEIGRTKLIEPTTEVTRRRGAIVNFSHPAYANRHIVARNDKEILRASLEKK